MKLFFTFCIVLYVLLFRDFIYFAFFVLYVHYYYDYDYYYYFLRTRQMNKKEQKQNIPNIQKILKTFFFLLLFIFCMHL